MTQTAGTGATTLPRMRVAEALLPEAIGKRIREVPIEDWREIIGVARDVYYDGANQPAPTTAYWPLFQDRFNGDKEMMRRSVNFVLRTPRAGSACPASSRPRRRSSSRQPQSGYGRRSRQ